MWVRGALFALVLGGCYSPSFETCSLVCASGETCPNGFECSNGRCAVEGSTCTAMMNDGGSDADDAMPIDNNTSMCANGTSQPGEICFKAPLQFNTTISGIFDAQFVDGNGDDQRDVMWVTATGYFYRAIAPGTFTLANVNTAGPTIASMNTFRGGNLNNNSINELVDNNPATGMIEVHEWNGTDSFGVAASQTSEMNAAQGIAIGRTTGAGSPVSIALVTTSKLRMFQLPGGGNLTPLTQSGNSFAISGGKDVAIADTDNDNVGEIAVADVNGIELFKNLNGNIVKISSPSIGQGVDAVANCNVDGDNDGEFVYAIRAGTAQPGRVGVVRWVAGTTYELVGERTVPNMYGVVECEDLDKDGYADAIVAATDGNMNSGVLVLRGRSDTTFEAPIAFPIPSPVTHLRANVSYNGDDVPDIIITSAAMGLVTILESNP